MEKNGLSIKIGNLVQAKILKYEYLVVFIILFALALKIFNVPNSGFINTLVLSAISCIYFFSAFAVNEEIEFTAFDLFIKKLVALASSVSLIGILFKFQHWPNSDAMLIIGLIAIIAGLIYIVIQKNWTTEIEKFDKALIIRILTLTLISAGLLYFGIPQNVA